jgi:outer membrane protein OmpA-like peptidoglycan-associated protein
MHRAFTCLALLFAIAATPLIAADDKPDESRSPPSLSPDDIIKALKPKSNTGPTGDFTERDRQTNRMAIDPKIPFDTNSATLNRAALIALETIGPTLNDERFATTTFLVAGHADASGDKNHNLALSERRADAVKLYLIRISGLQSSRFITVGYGNERLKDAAHPAAAANRRVEIFAMDTR